MPYNPFLDQFLMFYSQSEAGNGLTRGLENELARRTYVPTKLDRELAPAILAKQYRLVILTGNAGDGKTAFIQQVEASARQRGATITPTDSLVAGSFCRGGSSAPCTTGPSKRQQCQIRSCWRPSSATSPATTRPPQTCHLSRQ